MAEGCGVSCIKSYGKQLPGCNPNFPYTVYKRPLNPDCYCFPRKLPYKHDFCVYKRFKTPDIKLCTRPVPPVAPVIKPPCYNPSYYNYWYYLNNLASPLPPALPSLPSLPPTTLPAPTPSPCYNYNSCYSSCLSQYYWYSIPILPICLPCAPPKAPVKEKLLDKLKLGKLKKGLLKKKCKKKKKRPKYCYLRIPAKDLAVKKPKKDEISLATILKKQKLKALQNFSKKYLQSQINKITKKDDDDDDDD